MILLGAIGVLLSAACYWIAVPDRSPSWSRIFWAVAVMHIAASLVYWQYSLSFGADSAMYYRAPPTMFSGNISPGTPFMVNFVRSIKDIFGGSYLEFFLFFQVFGIAGISIIIRSAKEILYDLGQKEDWKIVSLFFLPGLHFWTCAIGKDGPLFLSTALSAWATIHIEKRYPAFIASIAVMSPIRPHIAAISIIAILATLMFDTRLRPAFKFPMLATTVAAATWIFSSAQQTLKIEELDPDTIGDFIASKQEYGMRSAEGAILTSLPFPLKVLSLMFRPFFLDAGGAFGLIVSFENAILLAIFVIIGIRWRDMIKLFSTVSYMRYCTIFSFTLITLLSLVTYNVGLGLRQKYMVMPAILLIFISLIAYGRARREEAMALTPMESDAHQIAPPIR